MIEELDSIALSADLPEHGLERGDLGTVVLVHGRSAAYEVEFVALGGEQLALLILEADQVEPANGHAIAHLRELEAA